MPNVQQPEMRRSGTTPLVQDTAGPQGGSGGKHPREHHRVPPGQQSPYGPAAGADHAAPEPHGRRADGD